MTPAIGWAERHQVALFLAALGAGALVGLAWPDVARPLEPMIAPVLGVLLYATFLGVPFAQLGRGLRDGRFVVSVLGLNFVVLPVIVWGLSAFVAHDQALLVGVLLVLLTPCVDYVVVFTGLAGGARARLLAVTPLLMVLQVILLPVYLWLMAGPEVVAVIDARPFVEAFVLLIVLPLTLAAATQALARRSAPARAFERRMLGVVVPLMMLTLGIVMASQIGRVAASTIALFAVVPIFALFAIVAAVGGAAASRVARLDVPGQRAVIFSGVTRNSLVVLPLALALPASFALTPLVVVTQTLVELLVMVVMVWLVPRVMKNSQP